MSIIAIAKITICKAFARPRRCKPARATRQMLPAKPPTDLPPESSKRAAKNPRPTTTPRPVMTAAVTTALPLYHHISAIIDKPPSRKSRKRWTSSTPMSARNTRSGEASPRRRRGGQAKKNRQTPAVTAPIKAGCHPAAPGSTGSKAPNNRMNSSCSPHPMTHPMTVPPNPIQNKLRPYNCAIS